MAADPTMQERLGQFRLFSDLSPEQFDEIARYFEEHRLAYNETIYQQGETPSYFYLVESGSVELAGTSRDGRTILPRRVEPNDFFGHRALLLGTARRTTARAQRDTVLLALNSSGFQAIMTAFPRLREKVQRIHVVNRLLATPLFGQFSREELFYAADVARILEYPAGQTIYAEGEPSDAFYVIDQGQVEEDIVASMASGQIWPKYLTAGSFFGRRELMNNAPRRATARAMTDVYLFRFNTEAFQGLCDLRQDFEQALERPDVLGYLHDTEIFGRLNARELRQLAGHIGLAHYPIQETLYNQGDLDYTLYYLYRGEAVVRVRDEQGRERPHHFMQPGKNQIVGQSSLILNDPRDATVVAVSDSDWLYLTREDLDQFLREQPSASKKLLPKEDVRIRQRLQRFHWMDPDEQFVLRDRRHWFFVVDRLIPPFILALLTLFLLMTDLPKGAVLAPLSIIGLYTIWVITDWANDYYIITNKRVAHREKVFMVRETRDETPLDKIQNVNIARQFVGNYLGFGKLTIDTAAAESVQRVVFDFLSDPEHVKDLIFQQMKRLEAGEKSETRHSMRDKMEVTLGTSIRPVIARPAAPWPVVNGPSTPSLLDYWNIFANATYRRWLWIEKREGDRVTWRKHWVRLIAKIWAPTLVLTVLLTAIVLSVAVGGREQAGLTTTLLVFLLPVGAWFWWNWENWGNDLYIVTSDRIIDTEQLPWGFRSQRTETKFDRIQNVRSDIPNPVATFLNYGTVMIYTAGAQGRLDFEYVRDPKQVQAEIFRRVTAYEGEQRRKQWERQWQDLPNWFDTYRTMERSGP